MPATYEQIATTTLSSATASITFNSIGSTYTDLRLVVVSQSTSGGANNRVVINSDTGSNYSRTILRGDGTSATSVRGTNESVWVFGASGTSPNWTMFTLDLFSYAGSTNKTALAQIARDANGSGNVERTVALWRNTAAINSIKIEVSGDTYATGTTATLFGIKAA